MTGSNTKLQGLKVLVIDDSKTIRRTAETLLAKEGCEVFTAIDGFDALAKIADHQPDIVFVDIMMPRLDGYQTCSLIKHNKVFRSIPVIMLSSKDGLFDRARGRIVGSEHYLTKPFTKDELLTNVTLYWMTQTVHSSFRLYHETKKAPVHFQRGELVRVPCAIARFPKEAPFPPREWIERGYNVERWTDMPRGGHFAAAEEPELLADDIHGFFGGLRA